MSRCFFPALILLMVVAIIGIVWLEHRPQGITMPLVQAASPICPSFEKHPCARMNCARRIA